MVGDFVQEFDENGEVKGMDKFLYNDCRGW